MQQVEEDVFFLFGPHQAVDQHISQVDTGVLPGAFTGSFLKLQLQVLNVRIPVGIHQLKKQQIFLFATLHFGLQLEISFLGAG